MSLNTTIYLLGEEQGKYAQYPSDYTEQIFRNYAPMLGRQSMLVLYRKDQLVYHLYYKRLPNGYVGICLLLNGVWLSGNPSKLSGLFEDALGRIVSQGELLTVDSQGLVVIKAGTLSSSGTGCVEVLMDDLRQILSSADEMVQKLPVVDVSISATTSSNLGENPTTKQWREAMKKYRTIVGHYSDRNEFGGMSPLLKQLRQFARDRDEYRRQCARLEKKCDEIEKQKKQYAWIIVLISILLLGAIVAVVVIVNKNNLIDIQRGRIEKMNDEIQEKTEKVIELKSENERKRQRIESLRKEVGMKDSLLVSSRCEVDSLKMVVSDRQVRIAQLEKEKNRLSRRIEELRNENPIKINSIQIGNVYRNGNFETSYGGTIYSSNSLYLKPKIYYNCNASGNFTLRVKWYTPEGKMSRGDSSPVGCSFEQTLYLSKGNNYAELSGWGGETKGHWKSGNYRVEIWINETFLISKDVRIY